MLLFFLLHFIRYPPLQTLDVLFYSAHYTHRLSNSHDDLRSVRVARNGHDDHRHDGEFLRDGVAAHELDNGQLPLHQPVLLSRLEI